jgi:hypothetical protein
MRYNRSMLWSYFKHTFSVRSLMHIKNMIYRKMFNSKLQTKFIQSLSRKKNVKNYHEMRTFRYVYYLIVDWNNLANAAMWKPEDV